MTPNPAAERRNNVSHGREPVERAIHGEFQPHRGGTIAASCFVPPGLGLWQFPVHGLTPVASVVSPLRGWVGGGPLAEQLPIRSVGIYLTQEWQERMNTQSTSQIEAFALFTQAAERYCLGLSNS